MKKVIEQMHMAQVTIAYGMTETSPVSFQSSLDYPPIVEGCCIAVAQGYPRGLVVGNSPGPSKARRRVIHNCEAPGG